MMRKYLLLIVGILSLAACGASKSKEKENGSLSKTMKTKDRGSFSLIDQIRQLPGVTLRNGVPVITKATNSIYDSGSLEPLYVLDDYIVGNSFRDVSQLVNPADIENIVTITGPEASYYGSRGGHGVIRITTIK